MIRDTASGGGNFCFTDKGIFSIDHSPEGRSTKISDTAVKCASALSEKGKYYLITDRYELMAFDYATCRLEQIADLKGAIPDGESVRSILPTSEGLHIGMSSRGVGFLSFSDIMDGNCRLQTTPIKSGIFIMAHDACQPIIWVGTDGKGLVRWHKSMLDFENITYEQLPYSIDMPARSILMDRRGNLWFGTKGDGLVVLKDFNHNRYHDKTNTLQFTTSNSSLLNNSVYALTGSRHDFFWIGSDGPGLNCYSYNENKIKRVKGTSGIRNVHAIIEQNDSTLWIATDGAGTYRCTFKINGKSITEPEIYRTDTIRFPAPFNDRNRIFAMAAESDSIMWFGSRGSGALRYNMLTGKGRMQKFKSDNGYASNTISHIAGTDKILFATGNGFAVYDPETGIGGMSDLAPDKAIHGILYDHNKSIWLSTNSGIVNINEQKKSCTQFNRNYGLKILEFSDGACYRDTCTNTLYFGGINGILAIREKSQDYLTQKPFIPDINITDFIQNNIRNSLARMIKNGRLTLPYSKSAFAISFSVVDNINYSDYVFSYNIEGLNDTWMENGNNDIIIMPPALPPGTYNLRIRYFNKATSIYGKESVLPVHITPPVYARWWAMTLYAVALLCILLYMVRYIKQKYLSMKEALHTQYLDKVRKARAETISNITEELSVLVTFILGTCQQLRQKTVKVPDLSEKVGQIEYNVGRINNIMYLFREYKNLNGINTEDVTIVPVSQMATEILGLMKNNAGQKKLSFRADIEKGLVWAINKDRWITMFNILLSVVVSHAADEGVVTISLHKAGERLRLFLKAAADETDINSEIRVGKKLIEDIGGTIVCYWDTYSQEVVIEATLPNQTPEMDSEHKKESDSQNIPDDNDTADISPKIRIGTKLNRVLLVSRSSEISFFLESFLSEQYNVKSFTDNASALADVGINIPAVIVYDVFSNTIGGFSAFLNTFKNEKMARRIQIVAMTSALQYNEQSECTRLGADLCISFPFNIEYMMASLERLLHKKRDIAEYYNSPISSYIVENSRIIHVEDKAFINRIFKIIDENISDPALSPASIAEKMSISLRVMYRKLEKITDIKPQKIIKDMRMKLAANLLASSKYTVDEIMYRCGYNNRSTFYKNFKKNYNCTPNEYRDNLRQHILQ